MSTITITAPNGATCTLDLADMFGTAVPTSNGTSKAPSKPEPAPTPAPEASKPAKADKPKGEPKAPKASKDERKAANLALANRIYTLADQGKYTEAIALATERGWPSVVTTVQKRREQALATSAMVHAPLTGADEADTGKVADALVKAKGKGRPASERCATHNTFLKADGTCGKCQGKGKGKPAPAPAPAPESVPEAPEASEPEAFTILTPEEAHSLQEHEQFPAGLSEADLQEHWRLLATKPYGRNMLQAIRKRCLKGVANMGLSTDERTIWATRRQAVTEILAA